MWQTTLTIQNPFMNAAIASAATNMGIMAATSTDYQMNHQKTNQSRGDLSNIKQIYLRLGDIYRKEEEYQKPEECRGSRMQSNCPITVIDTKYLENAEKEPGAPEHTISRKRGRHK